MPQTPDFVDARRQVHDFLQHGFGGGVDPNNADGDACPGIADDRQPALKDGVFLGGGGNGRWGGGKRDAGQRQPRCFWLCGHGVKRNGALQASQHLVQRYERQTVQVR